LCAAACECDARSHWPPERKPTIRSEPHADRSEAV
jgi:hypothetical protein